MLYISDEVYVIIKIGLECVIKIIVIESIVIQYCFIITAYALFICLIIELILS